MADKVALVCGVGRGTGQAVARRFGEGGYRVGLVARKESRMKEYEAEIEGSLALPCDITDPEALDEMLARCRKELGEPNVLVHNAARGTFGGFMEMDPADMEQNFQVNAMSLLHLARKVAPAMIEAGEGAIMVTGNTSAWRGKPSFSGFAPTKAAQRILTEAIARELGPKGIHVAYIVIDAVIDLWWTRKQFPDMPEDHMAQPADIAEVVYQTAHQPKTAWSFNVEVRPYAEVW